MTQTKITFTIKPNLEAVWNKWRTPQNVYGNLWWHEAWVCSTRVSTVVTCMSIRRSAVPPAVRIAASLKFDARGFCAGFCAG